MTRETGDATRLLWVAGARSWRNRLGDWLGVVFIPQAEEDARLAELQRAMTETKSSVHPKHSQH